MANYRSPGVYTEDIPTLPPSIAEVESAVPAFVGYTEKATVSVTDDVLNLPTPINGFADYLQIFGGAEQEDAANITIAVDELRTGTTTTGYKVTITPNFANLRKHILYHAVKHYFENGGGRCYIVSVGKYAAAVDKAAIEAGLDLIALEDEPTILLVPDAIFLGQSDFDEVNQKLLKQASDLKDRFAVIDTRTSTVPKTTTSINDDVTTAIGKVPIDILIRQFGAVYYPWLETTYNYQFDFPNLTLTAHTINGGAPGADDKTGKKMSELQAVASSMYSAINAIYSNYHIKLPPSAAIAGVYARTDDARGVWKAPANVGLLSVVKPTVNVSRSDQDLLNVNTDTGKSVNAIINVAGYGTVVMGARTLDGNDDEWKYINVRRFFSVVEESIKKSSNWVVFEPNTAATWVKLQAMIENYLTLKWRDGALAGAKPEQAFFVNVGLGKTMTSIDILEGRLIVEIGMAVSRPAEFVILRFIQMMQTS